MKVLLVDGGPHKEGCTCTALREVAGTLNKERIETEIFWIGNEDRLSADAESWFVAQCFLIFFMLFDQSTA